MSTSGENLFSSHYNLSVVQAAWFYLSQGAQFSYSHRRFAASSIAPPTRHSAFLQRYKYVIIQYSTMWEMREYFRIVKLMDGKSHTYGCNIMPAEHISAWAIQVIFCDKKRRWRNLILRDLGNKSCHASVLVIYPWSILFKWKWHPHQSCLRKMLYTCSRIWKVIIFF